MKDNNTENDNKKAKGDFTLLEKDIVHLHEAPIIDNTQFVIKAHTKTKEHFVNTAVISDSERRQYFSSGMKDDKNVLLARKAKEAIKEMESDIAHKQDETAKTSAAAEYIKAREANEKNAATVVDITSKLDFSSLISNAVLKDI
jgi:hypothetical protein